MRKAGTDFVSMEYYNQFNNKGRKTANNPVNNRLYMLERMYTRVLGELAMNRFQWTGFPPSVDTRYLEMTMYFHALSVVFVDKNTDKMFALRGAPSGPRNMVDNPLAFTLTGNQFQGITLSSRNCVPIWANYFRSPDLDIVQIYANFLANVHRTIEINAMSARRNKVLVYDENSRLSAENINRQIDEGQASIAVKSTLGDMIAALDLGVDPKSLEALSILRARIWSEAMGLLGINNANMDKKERLVSDEVDANNDQIENTRRVNLNERQNAAEKINVMFAAYLDTPVSVDFHTEIGMELDLVDTEMGAPIGDVHD